MMLRIGTLTRWGKISAVMSLDGERYYLMSTGQSVSLLPESAVKTGLEETRT